MKIYRVIKNGIQTNSWNETLGDHTRWEPCFGQQEKDKEESECTQEEISSSISSEERTIREEETILYPEELDEEGNVVTPAKTVVIPAIVKKFYKIPAEYQVIIEDIIETREEKIRKEMSEQDLTHEKFLDLLMDNDNTALIAFRQSVKAIKNKYPKPS